MIYLDNASTSWPKARGVGPAMLNAIEQGGSPWRAGHRAAAAATRAIDELRLRLARLIGADDPARIVLTGGGTDSLHLAIDGALMAIREGAPAPGGGRLPVHVVTTVLEHNSVRRPLHHAERRGEVEITFVPCDEFGIVPAKAVADACRENTALVVITHVSNVLGTAQPVEQMSGAIRARYPADSAPLLLVDASQSVGILPIDVRALGADLLAFPGHKGLLGPAGTGVLWIGERAMDLPRNVRRISPVRVGGGGGASNSNTMPEGLPRMFEAGTLNTPAFAGLHAAVQEHDAGAHAGAMAHARRLIRHYTGGGGGSEGVRVLGHPRAGGPGPSVPLVTLAASGIEPGELATALDANFEIAVRTGLMCAPLTHRAMGTGDKGGLRVSPGPSTTDDQIDQFIAAMDELVPALAAR